VTDDHVVLGRKPRGCRWIDDDAPAAEALADVVVRVTAQLERDARREECAEALARGAGEAHADRVVGQTSSAVSARDVAGNQGADGAPRVIDRQRELDALAG